MMSDATKCALCGTTKGTLTSLTSNGKKAGPLCEKCWKKATKLVVKNTVVGPPQAWG